jgi:formate dehydrogenase subunit gamma
VTVVRFDRRARFVHWSTSLLFFVALVTAACLYLPFLASAVGRRSFIKDLHLISGFGLLVPLIVGVTGARGRALRAELGQLNRWDDLDHKWLKSAGRDKTAPAGKYNAGQKLNSAFLLGALITMLFTGAIMFWHDLFRLEWRTGATFVHDWLALALFVVIAGHIGLAFATKSLSGMLHGTVSKTWARHHHPRWEP